MKAGDAILLELARKAAVRPTVIFHAFHYRMQMGERFSVEGYSSFTGLPIDHAIRVMAVLNELPQREKRERKRAVASLLPDGFTVPEEWLLAARAKRFWSMDVCQTEGEAFVRWHQMKGTSYANWKMAWLNWIDKSHRESGSSKPADEAWTPERMKAYTDSLR